jgi:hypothetical protein
MWDEVTSVGLLFWMVHPDIVTCIGPEGRQLSCSEQCSDFEHFNDSKRCRVPFPRGAALPTTGRLRVQAWDADPGGRNQLMADGFINASDPCLRFREQPCQIQMPNGLFVFALSPPESPPLVVVRGNPLPPEGGSAPAGPPSAEVVDDALQLRDRDSCSGADQFMPQGSAFAQTATARQLGTDRASRVYQTASFAMAISNQATKAAVLAALRTTAGEQAYFAALTGIVADQQQASGVFNGYQSVAGAVANRIASTGLDRSLPRQGASAADVDGWIMKRLSTPAQISDAVTMMLDPSQNVTAECALNQLAKDGFIDTLNGR